eukprot:Gb_24675 [translate_table: standard]
MRFHPLFILLQVAGPASLLTAFTSHFTVPIIVLSLDVAHPCCHMGLRLPVSKLLPRAMLGDLVELDLFLFDSPKAFTSFNRLESSPAFHSAFNKPGIMLSGCTCIGQLMDMHFLVEVPCSHEYCTFVFSAHELLKDLEHLVDNATDMMHKVTNSMLECINISTEENSREVSAGTDIEEVRGSTSSLNAYCSSMQLYFSGSHGPYVWY